MKNARGALLAALIIMGAAVTLVATADAADSILSGAITSAAGEKLGGVTVSAKPAGGTVTTTVFTDESGDYYFPPLPAGKYRVWAQAVSFETAKAEVDLPAARKQGFVLNPMKDFVRQLPGNVMLSALPEESEQDKRMKRMVRNNCTGCHTPSYFLQHRFDEAGWHAIIELMKNANVYGTFVGNDRKPAGILDYHQKELAAYLARARGPGEGAMKFKPDPRPSGESARVMFKEYDVPLDPDSGLPSNFVQNDGSDWSLGTPSVLIPGWGVHDAWLDLDGQLWFTCNIPNRRTTIGKIDTKTGEVKLFKVAAPNGLAAQTHGMTRDDKGVIWFNVNNGRGGLGRLDPKAEKIDVYMTPPSMSPLGGAVTLDVDGKGKVWASAPDGAVRFDPETERFTDFKSLSYKTARGTGMTYGAAGDRDGNGWWTQMAFDTVGKGDMATGKTLEVKLPAVQAELDRATPEARAFYEKFDELSFNSPLPWQQGPRRMGTDKNADVLWVGNSWGGTLSRIDTKTLEATLVPLPDPTSMQPYHLVVDNNHNVWGNLWTNDQILKYDPGSSKWTIFELPVRGTEIRHISLDERNGVTQVILPVYRTNQMGVMTLRNDADLAALKAQAGR